MVVGGYTAPNYNNNSLKVTVVVILLFQDFILVNEILLLISSQSVCLT